MNRRLVLGCVLALGLCVCSTAVAAFFFVRTATVAEPGGVEITVDAPTQVPPGQPFAIDITVQNLGLERKVLDSIDVENSYLRGIALEATTPAFNNSFEIPLVGFQSYSFGETIAGNTTTRVTLEMVGEREGTFAGDIDVCINEATACLTFPVETTIGVGDGR